MRIICANHSGYPRVGKTSESQGLRRAYGRRETGEIDDAGFSAIVQDKVAEVIKEQTEAGCDLVTDGQVHWYDLIAHPTSSLKGLTVKGLLRWFDTNTYVRQPEVTEAVRGNLNLASDFTYATTVSSVPVKAIITGPYTLAKYSILSADVSLESLTGRYAEIVGEEVNALAKAGADVIQIEEPSLLANPQDIQLVRQALSTCVQSKGGSRISLVTYFGDAGPLLADLVDMPAEIIGLDLSYGPSLVDTIATQKPHKTLALGIVDGRNTALEDDSFIVALDRVATALDAQGVDELHVQPSCSLEYLPRDRAEKKLQRLRTIADTVSKVGA